MFGEWLPAMVCLQPTPAYLSDYQSTEPQNSQPYTAWFGHPCRGEVNTYIVDTKIEEALIIHLSESKLESASRAN